MKTIFNSLKINICLVALFFSGLTWSQIYPTDYPITEMEEGIISFSCGLAGQTSTEISMVKDLLIANDFSTIRNLLDSKNNALKCLAVIVCELLSENKKVVLTENELQKMNSYYRSSYTIGRCSGCNIGDKTTMENILNNSDGFSLKKDIRSYYQEFILK